MSWIKRGVKRRCLIVRHCEECGGKVDRRSVTGLCSKCYRANGSEVTKKVKKDQPCLLCKKPRSEHKYMYCDYCRKTLFDTGDMAGHMRMINRGMA